MESSSSLGLVLGPGFVQGRESRARAILLQRLLGTRLRACNRRPLAHLRGSPPRTLKRQWKPRVPQECPILAPPHPQALANPPNNTGSCPPPFLPKPLGSRFKAWTAFSNFGERVQLLARSPSPLRCHFFFPYGCRQLSPPGSRGERPRLLATVPWRLGVGERERELDGQLDAESNCVVPTWTQPGGGVPARARTDTETHILALPLQLTPPLPGAPHPTLLGVGVGGQGDVRTAVPRRESESGWRGLAARSSPGKLEAHSGCRGSRAPPSALHPLSRCAPAGSPANLQVNSKSFLREDGAGAAVLASD